MDKPKIFLSYSWANKKNADRIYHDLSFMDFDIIKDDHEIKYSDRISRFMTQIREADFALILICDSYLHSVNCMKEVLLLKKDNNIWEKILPVVSAGIKISNPIDRINIVNFWQEKTRSIEDALKNISPINAVSTYDELKIYKQIEQEVDSFLSNINDLLYTTPKELFSKRYSPIIEKIGKIPNYDKALELILLSFIQDPKERFTLLEDFYKRHQSENSYYYSILASCYRDLKKYKQSIKFYKKAIELDEANHAALNNLGQVYEHTYSNYDLAKTYYERAIEAKPELDIPRLNLGVLLDGHFPNSEELSIYQYEEIIKLDECNPKAHNNLGNIYRNNGSFKDLDRAEKHFLIAVSQDNIEAIINYANFLKVERKDFAKGNSYYLKAKELNTDPVLNELIETLLKSEKG